MKTPYQKALEVEENTRKRNRCLDNGICPDCGETLKEVMPVLWMYCRSKQCYPKPQYIRFLFWKVEKYGTFKGIRC